MSIDAQIHTVYLREDGSGKFMLIDRPPQYPGDTPGIAGQEGFWFKHAPEEVTALNGLNIWGGDSQIMLGDKKIASREGYTGIVFVDDEAFKAAIAAYHRRDVS